MGREEFHRRFAHPGAGESERVNFPFWVRNDRDLFDLVAVGKEKIEVIPVRPLFPAFEIFHDRQEPRFGSGINLPREFILETFELRLLENAPEMKDTDIVGLESRVAAITPIL